MSVSLIDGHIDPDTNRMTAKEIIKALECSVNGKCPECPYFHSYPCDKCRNMRKDALDLINRQQGKIDYQEAEINLLKDEKTEMSVEIIRQQAEIGRLTTLAELGKTRANDYRVMRDRALKAEKKLEKQQAKIERLTINMNAFGLGMKQEKERADTIRAEAIKEFAGKLTDIFYSHDKGDTYVREVVYNLVKEMAGEQE